MSSIYLIYIKRLLIQIMILKVLFLIAAFFSEFSLSEKVVLFTHTWCRRSDKAQVILKKLKLQSSFSHVLFSTIQKKQHQLMQTFDNSQEQILNELNLQNLYRDQKIPYPSVYFQCQNYKGFYQNQLTFTQLSYWTYIYCTQVNELPSCPAAPYQYKFEFSQQNWKNAIKDIKEKRIQFLINSPQAKICAQSQSLNNKSRSQPLSDSQTDILQNIKFQNSLISLSQLHNINIYPLFFRRFNHNIRNYMISHDKTAIMMIYTDAENFKNKQFEQVYKSVMTQKSLMSEQLRKIRDQYPLVYQISQQNRQKLVFISTCYNPSQPAKCNHKGRNDKMVRHQRSKQKTIRSLLNFINLKDYFQQTFSNQLIFSFAFNKKTDSLQKYIYDDSSHKLGNQFLFWIDWIFKRQQNIKDHQLKLTKDLCLKNQIVHYYDPRNLKSIQENVNLFNIFRQKDIQIRIKSIQSASLPQYRFKVCKQHNQPFCTNQIQQVAQFNFKESSQQNLMPEQL